jgi:hypothetical protein
MPLRAIIAAECQARHGLWGYCHVSFMSQIGHANLVNKALLYIGNVQLLQKVHGPK